MFIVGGPAVLNGPPAWFNAGIAAALAPINARIDGLRVDIMKSMNRSAVQPQDELVPVVNAAGNAPPARNFPATLQHLVNLSAANSNALIAHYGLPGGGNVAARRRRIAAHIGIRPHHLV